MFREVHRYTRREVHSRLHRSVHQLGDTGKVHIIAIIAIIAIALTKACPIRYHTLASDSTRGRRNLPFDRGALPKRYVRVSRTLPR